MLEEAAVLLGAVQTARVVQVAVEMLNLPLAEVQVSLEQLTLVAAVVAQLGELQV